MNFDALFTFPNGRVSRAQFIPALIIVLTAMVFFTYLVTGRTAQFCVLVLLYPAFVLLAKRLYDMGHSAWLAIIPLALMLTSLGIQLGYVSPGDSIEGVLPWVALVVSAAYALWGCMAQTKGS